MWELDGRWVINYAVLCRGGKLGGLGGPTTTSAFYVTVAKQGKRKQVVLNNRYITDQYAIK